jgi:hypothetical protein
VSANAQQAANVARSALGFNASEPGTRRVPSASFAQKPSSMLNFRGHSHACLAKLLSQQLFHLRFVAATHIELKIGHVSRAPRRIGIYKDTVLKAILAQFVW